VSLKKSKEFTFYFLFVFILLHFLHISRLLLFFSRREWDVMFVVCSETVLFFVQLVLLILMTFGKSPSLPCQLNASLRHTLTTYAVLGFSH